MDATLAFALALFVYILIIVVSKLIKNKNKSCSVSTLIVAGSGGHTKEILLLAEKLGNNYNPRHYVVASTDVFSIKKIHACERQRSKHFTKTETHKSEYSIYAVPRSREVRQSWLTSIFTTLCASLRSLQLVFQLQPEVILCNGPGTCVPICIAGLILKVLGISDTRIIYVESICRVKTLSLSAKLLYPFVDCMLVQWPELLSKYPHCQYIGRVV